jgi:nickel-dependent lactate racemase
MNPTILYGRGTLEVRLAGEAAILEPSGLPALADGEGAVAAALADPIDSAPLAALAAKLPADQEAVIVISDITRPVPNQVILPPILQTLRDAGVSKDRITILVATGMHRPSTDGERLELCGQAIVDEYRIVDHRSDDKSTLVQLPEPTSSGTRVWVNRRYVEAGLKIATGFIEPHFMAGFSGGRKAICPGLVNLETIQKFHGPGFLENPAADTGVLDGNPCHIESRDVARMVGIDFLVNVTIDMDKNVTGVFAGDFESAHAAGVRGVEDSLTVPIEDEYDIVVTCGGGYPLDTTYYQSIKGMVLATPYVKTGGTMVLACSCTEGIGTDIYRDTMFAYHGKWEQFVDDICQRDEVVKDQWEFEMQCKTLRKIGPQGCIYITEGVDEDSLRRCSVLPAKGCGELPAQQMLDQTLASLAVAHPDATWAVIPVGPYILPRVMQRVAS